MGTAAPSGTITFPFTKIGGSTRLWESIPEPTRVALARHDSILRSTIDGHDGYVFATRVNGFAVAFAPADDALQAAVDAQTAERYCHSDTTRVRITV